MSITVNDLQRYREALKALVATEKTLVDGGLIFEHESLSFNYSEFIEGRISRIQTLIDSNRY